jgi:hypothetical protein
MRKNNKYALGIFICIQETVNSTQSITLTPITLLSFTRVTSYNVCYLVIMVISTLYYNCYYQYAYVRIKDDLYRLIRY